MVPHWALEHMAACYKGSLVVCDDFDFDFATSTTCHGMKRFCNSWHIVRRSFWVFITISTMLLLGQQLIDRFSNFAKFELKTEITLQAAKSLPLPMVTICNLNLFSKSLLTDMDFELLQDVSFELSRIVTKNYIETDSSKWSVSDYWRLVDHFVDLENEILRNYNVRNFSVDNWIRKAGWQMVDPVTNDSALLSCRVGRTMCTAANFKQILTPQGLCYSLNFQEPLISQKMPGGDSGINILLDIKQDEYTPFLLNGDYGQYECGTKVIIGDWFDNVDLGMGVGVTTGFLGYISVRKIRRTTVNEPPWGNCEEKRPYSSKLCHDDCAAQHSIEACGCRLWYEPPVKGMDAPICGVAMTTACSLLKGLPEEEILEERCIKRCLDACESTSYTVSTSYNLLTTNNTLPAFVNYLNIDKGRNFTGHQVLRNVLALQVGYPELIVETMASTPAQSVSSFLGDIGGQLGLFAGISLITFIELLEYPFLKIAHIINKRRGANRKYPVGNTLNRYRSRTFGLSVSANVHTDSPTDSKMAAFMGTNKIINKDVTSVVEQNEEMPVTPMKSISLSTIDSSLDGV